uniref:Maelstrom domain-containing protein n=1 Tax=Heligmosomoides polygyrus TaxID=6339 RepID=A0A183GM29_HELPZ
LGKLYGCYEGGEWGRRSTPSFSSRNKKIQAITSHLGGDCLDHTFADKYETDRAMVREAILNQTNGCTEKIKELRFLIAAVQTFGNVDGMCLMAEYAMNEFNLRDGVVDRFSTLVGPWQIPNDIQRNRAEFHSNETHRIPLSIGLTQYDKRQASDCWQTCVPVRTCH